MCASLSSSTYHLILEQAPVMIWHAGIDTLYDYFNQRWLAFRGRSLEQERGSGWAEGVHSQDFERSLQIYLASFELREPFEMEYRLLRHDGRFRWIFERGEPLFNAKGEFDGYVGNCLDITTRIEGERTLMKRQEEQIKCLKKLLPICYYCRKNKDDPGYIQQVERYVSQHSQPLPVRGICPECASVHSGVHTIKKTAQEPVKRSVSSYRKR